MGRFLTTTRAPAPERRPQLVHLGRTQGGTPGLFTGGMLAWPVSDAEYAVLRTMPTRELRSYVQRRGFELNSPTAD